MENKFQNELILWLIQELEFLLTLEQKALLKVSTK